MHGEYYDEQVPLRDSSLRFGRGFQLQLEDHRPRLPEVCGNLAVCETRTMKQHVNFMFKAVTKFYMDSFLGGPATIQERCRHPAEAVLLGQNFMGLVCTGPNSALHSALD